MATTGLTFGGGPITGVMTEGDKKVALSRIKEENERRAALDPPGEVLPFGTNAEIRNSLEQYWAWIQLKSHLEQMPIEEENALRSDVSPRWRISSNAQRLNALSQLEPLPPK